MSQITLEDASSQLARLADQASRGEEVILLRDTTPVAKIVPVPEDKPEERPASHFGNAKDVLIYMADDFDAPLEALATGENRG